MPSAPIPGFITKKQATETFNRSHRQLTRDLGNAMTAQDENVLSQFKLRTEDGAIYEGIAVTNELIAQLRSEGRNPMWYVRESWMEHTHGVRGDVPRAENPIGPADVPQGGGLKNSHLANTDILAMLQHRISELEQDKQDLRSELRIKNDQIKEANDREKETNVLMRDLHELMRDMQHRLLPPPQVARVPDDDPVQGGGIPILTSKLPPPNVIVFGEDRQPNKMQSPIRQAVGSRARRKPLQPRSTEPTPANAKRQKHSSTGKATAAPAKSTKPKRGLFARLFG